jgi:hypothetical protein
VLILVQNPDCVRDFAASPASPVAHQILANAARTFNTELRFSHVQNWSNLQAQQHDAPTTNFPRFGELIGQSTCKC